MLERIWARLRSAEIAFVLLLALSFVGTRSGTPLAPSLKEKGGIDVWSS